MHPIIHSLIEVYVVEKLIVDKHGDATARHRTDIETEWRHRTFPRRFAPLLCRVMSSNNHDGSEFLREAPLPLVLIDRVVCLFLVRRINIAFRPRKYRLAEATVGFGGPAKK